MNKEELLKAIDLLIAKYQRGVNGEILNHWTNSCPLCELFYSSNCEDCPNKIFAVCDSYDKPCVSRGKLYNLEHYNSYNYSNLIKYWKSMKELFLSIDSGSSDDMKDYKDIILYLANPYKK